MLTAAVAAIVAVSVDAGNSVAWCSVPQAPLYGHPSSSVLRVHGLLLSHVLAVQGAVLDTLNLQQIQVSHRNSLCFIQNDLRFLLINYVYLKKKISMRVNGSAEYAGRKTNRDEFTFLVVLYLT